MSKGYVIFTEGPIRDQGSMDEYGQKSFPSMMQAGGRLLIADDGQVLEGEWPAARTVIIEFDSVDAARAWYESPEYEAAIPLRQAAADTNVILVEGFEMPAH